MTSQFNWIELLRTDSQNRNTKITKTMYNSLCWVTSRTQVLIYNPYNMVRADAMQF